MRSIRIGTSSWSDPGFIADWYPHKLPARARLGWYAEHFDYVEVNSTFYAIPLQKVTQRWDAETPAHFLFDVKVHRLLSRHAATLDTLPPDLRQGREVAARGRVLLTPELEREVALRFREELAPLREAGKLGAWLLQLSPSFSPGKHRLEELQQLVEILGRDRLAIELRNRDWVAPRHAEETLAFFRNAHLPLVLVDAPASEHFTVMPSEDVVTAPLAYLRLHGRNERGYITGKSVAERFDYDYSADEIEEIGARVRRLAEEAAEVHVAFNNNRSSYAPKAALALKQTLGKRL
jgi:uncharacterized protein YecE (DUF72 family)